MVSFGTYIFVIDRLLIIITKLLKFQMQNEGVLFLFKRDPFKKNSYLMLMFLPDKNHVYIAFKIPISDYDYFDKLIDFISQEWGKKPFLKIIGWFIPGL